MSLLNRLKPSQDQSEQVRLWQNYNQKGGSLKLPNCDAYFETIHSKKRLPYPLRESLTAAFARIPVSSFPKVPGGKVIEISADTSIGDAVKILSECNILSAPVRNTDVEGSLENKTHHHRRV